MKNVFKNIIAFAFAFSAIYVAVFAASVFAGDVDTIGVAGQHIASFLSKYGMEAAAGTIVSLIGALLFRLIQMALQRLPTKWKWVNNKLTVGIFTRIVQKLFGTTTTLYNAQLEENAMSSEKAKEELRKKALEHLGRKGGILKEFEKAMKEMDK